MTAPVFILAGEPSGDQIAAHLMQAINQYDADTKWMGVGGPLMQKAGLQTLTDMEALSIIGFGSALRAYGKLSRLADNLVEAVMTTRPRLVLTIDAKGFSQRFARRLRRRMKAVGWSAPIVHCVAPTVWAWGRWRAKTFARDFDGLLCLFPFEPAYFPTLGLDAKFIGHPEAFMPIEKSSGKKTGHITILPGSRRREIQLLLPIMLRAANLLQQRYPGLKFTLPAVPQLKTLISEMVEDFTAETKTNTNNGPDVKIIDAATGLNKALATSTAMMAASGTVTLQTALYAVPGIACYRMGAFSAFIGRRLVNMDQVILPNAILGRQLYAFLFQQQVTEQGLADALGKVIDDPAAANTARNAANELRAILTGDNSSFADLAISALQPWLNRKA